MTNLELMGKRLEFQGGIDQESRMIKDKWRTFQRAKKYSYQACLVQKLQAWDEVLDVNPDALDPGIGIYEQYKALINPDKTKPDYDDKVISIDYSSNYGPGDVFEWMGTDSVWIIYTQEKTEDAYYRGAIRRCKHKIRFKDKEGNWCATWASIRGPVETQINSIQKNQKRIDEPNLSLNILMPRNEKTLAFFDRYAEFLFDGRCWRVEAPDSISMNNIIEVNAEEYYINIATDDIENEMKDGLVIEPVDPSPSSGIEGNTWIKPMITEIYRTEEANGKWKILDNAPVTICTKGNKSVSVTWDKGTSGQFVLQWSKGDKVLQKTIVVESLY